jgi:hypothetical protein
LKGHLVLEDLEVISLCPHQRRHSPHKKHPGKLSSIKAATPSSSNTIILDAT